MGVLETTRDEEKETQRILERKRGRKEDTEMERLRETEWRKRGIKRDTDMVRVRKTENEKQNGEKEEARKIKKDGEKDG